MRSLQLTRDFGASSSCQKLFTVACDLSLGRDRDSELHKSPLCNASEFAAILTEKLLRWSLGDLSVGWHEAAATITKHRKGRAWNAVVLDILSVYLGQSASSSSCNERQCEWSEPVKQRTISREPRGPWQSVNTKLKTYGACRTVYKHRRHYSMHACSTPTRSACVTAVGLFVSRL